MSGWLRFGGLRVGGGGLPFFSDDAFGGKAQYVEAAVAYEAEVGG